ncbi:hypothetical protein D3C83_05510 [compost metagenome]
MPMEPPNWTAPLPRRPVSSSRRMARVSNATTPLMLSSACGRPKWRMRPFSTVILPVMTGSRIAPSNVVSSAARPVLRTLGTNPCRMPRLALPVARMRICSLWRSTMPDRSSSVSCPVSRISARRTVWRSSAMRIGAALRSA